MEGNQSPNTCNHAQRDWLRFTNKYHPIYKYRQITSSRWLDSAGCQLVIFQFTVKTAKHRCHLVVKSPSCCSYLQICVSDLWGSVHTLDSSMNFCVCRWQQISHFHSFITVNCLIITNRLHVIANLITDYRPTPSYCTFIIVLTHNLFSSRVFIVLCSGVQ